MILGAHCDLKGHYAGIVSRDKPVKGPQMWLIRFTRMLPPDPNLPKGHKNYGEPIRDEREVVTDGPITIDQLGPYAQDAIKDLYVDGVIECENARWEAFYIPKQQQADHAKVEKAKKDKRKAERKARKVSMGKRR